MKAQITAIGFLLASAACTPQPDEVATDPAFAESAAMLADRYQADLQTELVGALQQVGAAGAIGVCQSAAPAIAASLSDAGNLTISRIARRNRNADNTVPQELEALYTALEQQPLTDGGPHRLAAVIGDRRVFLQAIPMKDQPCAQCHGTAISPDVQAAIAARYPADRATGFVAGELRGAMLVTQRIP